VARMVNEHSVYLVDSSRINVAGINANNMPYFFVVH
jgi:aspartate/tyrosine/aromatic aminotransferase